MTAVKYTGAKIDRLVEKMISRKFMVWLTATGLMVWAGLESSDFENLANYPTGHCKI